MFESSQKLFNGQVLTCGRANVCDKIAEKWTFYHTDRKCRESLLRNKIPNEMHSFDG